MILSLNDLTPLKGDTPIMYCDFDGVINALNRFPEWNDPNSKPTELDYIFQDPTKWHVETYPVPNDTHYAPDNEQEVEFRGRQYIIQWSSELIEELNSIINSQKINFVWLTTWKEYTDSLLNDLLGLNVLTGSWLNFPQRGGGFSGKLEALIDLTSTVPNSPPFVWVDDEDTRGLENHDNPENTRLADMTGTKTLVIQPNPDYGISRKEIESIKKFIY